MYETVRLARKGHTFLLRVAFALLALVMLYTAKPSENPPPSPVWVSAIDTLEDPDFDPMERFLQVERARLEQFAAEFTKLFILALAVAVTLVTPLYMATAV